MQLQQVMMHSGFPPSSAPPGFVPVSLHAAPMGFAPFGAMHQAAPHHPGLGTGGATAGQMTSIPAPGGGHYIIVSAPHGQPGPLPPVSAMSPPPGVLNQILVDGAYARGLADGRAAAARSAEAEIAQLRARLQQLERAAAAGAPGDTTRRRTVAAPLDAASAEALSSVYLGNVDGGASHIAAPDEPDTRGSRTRSHDGLADLPGADCGPVDDAALANAPECAHVNYLYDSIDDVAYPRFAPGTVYAVAMPKTKAASHRVASELLLRTATLQPPRHVLTHCAHFLWNRVCFRGATCCFVHAVSLAGCHVWGNVVDRRALALVAVASPSASAAPPDATDATGGAAAAVKAAPVPEAAG
jgi:hypothetical protein